jgi:hypothetical protein
MSDLKTAAQQALEALEFMADEWGFTQKANRPERWQAIEALRTALAQQEPRNQCGETCERAKLCAVCARGLEQQEQKPYCYAYEYDCAFGVHIQFHPRPYDGKAGPDRAVPLYAHPPRRETEQEPVASIYVTIGGEREFDDWRCPLPVGRNLLYTHPPRRETEQEPVAWIQPDHLQKARQAPFLCRVEPTKRMSDFVPIYTHPPRREWRSLSEKEIGDVFYAARNAKLGAANDNSRHRLSVVEIARAVEQALKEKNHE